jgi:hypothetical protein
VRLDRLYVRCFRGAATLVASNVVGHALALAEGLVACSLNVRAVEEQIISVCRATLWKDEAKSPFAHQFLDRALSQLELLTACCLYSTPTIRRGANVRPLSYAV